MTPLIRHVCAFTPFTDLITTYFFRSNTETLFPTGLTTAFPSLEKLRFPCRYTAPSRFENYETHPEPRNKKSPSRNRSGHKLCSETASSASCDVLTR